MTDLRLVPDPPRFVLTPFGFLTEGEAWSAGQCSCGGQGVCVVCVLADLEREPDGDSA